MQKKLYRDRKHEIEQKLGEDEGAAYKLIGSLVYDLWEEKDYSSIVELYKWRLLSANEALFSFEVAYALAQCKCDSDAEHVYSQVLQRSPRNSSVLNNLSLLKWDREDIDGAWELIQRAKAIAPEDEIIDRNYNSLKTIIDDRRAKEEEFRLAVDRISTENDFVLSKLRCFLDNARKDRDFDKFVLPIPTWKFKVLMGTDQQKASSLADQWLEKAYIRRTGERGPHNEHIYEINPYLRKAIDRVEGTKVPKQWSTGIQLLDAEQLERLGYFEVVRMVKRVKRVFRAMLQRDFDELFLNYLMGNNKAVVVLSGSLVETLLIYHCEKKKITEVSYERGRKTIRKRLYEADLGDLLDFFQQKGIMSGILVHMGNIARISRNFVHPGKELRRSEQLTRPKAEICFLSALEVAREIC